MASIPTVVLLSGGMDSVTALYDAAQSKAVRPVAALSFHYGSKHNDRELPCARRHALALGIPHKVIPLDFIGQMFASNLLLGGGDIPRGHYEDHNMRQTVVPFRNGILLAIAAGYAESIEAEAVTIAAHVGDHTIYPDCREAFMQAFADAMRLGTYAGVQLLRPFIEMSKAEIVQHGTRLGINFRDTWSCYVGGAVHCGECGTCVERREAFSRAGVPDPTPYLSTAPLPPQPAH